MTIEGSLYVIQFGGFMHFLKVVIVLFVLHIASVGGAPLEITNVQFTDDKGQEYDLFELLDRGTHVYIELVDNN